MTKEHICRWLAITGRLGRRKSVIAAAVIGLMMCALSGCGSTDETTGKKTVITIGNLDMNQIDDMIVEYVEKFNEEHQDYEIEIRDYSESEDDVSAFNMDVAAGRCPDIIISERTRLARLIHIGLLADMMPFLEKDPDVHREDLIDSVMQAWTQGQDSLYYMAADFSVGTIFGKKEKFPANEGGWTRKEILEYADGSDVPLFYENSKLQMFDILIATGMDDYLDWDRKKASFDSDEFQSILEYCNKGTKKGERAHGDADEPAYFMKDKCLLDFGGMINYVDIEDITRRYTSDIVCMGYPDKSRCISCITFRHCFSISSKSEHQDVVWDFIKQFFTKEGQYQFTRMHSFPVRRDVLAMQRKEATATESYIDEFGNKIEPLNVWSEEMTYTPLTSEEADLVDEIIAGAKHSFLDDAGISQIVYEEVQAYFNGDCTIDRVGETINSRVETYMNENR